LLGSAGDYQLTGMLGELDSNRADLAIGALSVNPERKRYVDLSFPWLYHGIEILEKWVNFIERLSMNRI
jgi:ABC-type amino acid transport substrate-binding protein